MNFTTIDDAETFVWNSGTCDWEWGDGASAEGFAHWLWLNREEVDEDDYDEELASYLRSVDQNPAEYGVGKDK